MIYMYFYVFYWYRYGTSYLACWYLQCLKNGYILQQTTLISGICATAAVPPLPDITDDISSHHAFQLMLNNQTCLHTEGRTAFLF
jgi:hypothetical protein